ncbi:MAG: hypothetical protein SFY66_11025 [Oculatellaceae cyanobacterium bins.114]|nr:hypothetical protein [Oculatellaceae cyanobacterium bins.114]
MRVPTVAFYTLATFTVADLTQAAIASPTPPPLDANGKATELTEVEVTLPESIDSITPPEPFITEFPDRAFNQAGVDPQPTLKRSVVGDGASFVSDSPDISTSDGLMSDGLTSDVLASNIAPPEALRSLERVRVPERSSNPDLAIHAIAPDLPPLVEAIASDDWVAPSETVPSPDLVALAQPHPIETQMEIEFPLSTSADLLRDRSTLMAQSSAPSEAEIEELQQQLESLEPDFSDDYGNEFEGSPAVTISNPSGFGADNFRGFVNFGFQSETRYSDQADGTMGIGIGLGDAQRAVGLQLSYTLASFGENRDFGTGGFNAKLHRQFSNGLGIAVGWEGFATTGEVDFEDTVYGSITQIIRTNDDLDDAFSRIALTAGVGNGRFRSEDAVTDDEDTVGVFGSIAVRVARPVSAIVEWTGQDLAVGLSITPIRGFPLVITPALRDIAGAGDGARFVLGTGISFQF